MKLENYDSTESADGCAAISSAANRCSMIEIGGEDYAAVAGLLAEAIGGREFFNGSVTYDCASFSSRLTATLLIYRDRADPDTITGMVPVWWEFATFSADGRPTANDFSFSELKSLF
jgi:hypothetical protein